MSNLIQPAQAIIVTDADGKQIVAYEPTPKQLEFHARTEPNVLFWGGRGSGKSLALRWDAHLRALATPNFVYVLLRRTFPQLQSSHLMFIEQDMKLLGGYYHHTKKMAMYPNGSVGIYSQCSGDEDVLNLLSSQFGAAYFDEISTFPWDMFTKLAASTRVLKGAKITAVVRAATNPLGVSTEEIKRYFIDKDVEPEDDPEYNPDDWYNIKANLEDNPHLDQEQYRKRFSGLSSHTRKAWLDGEFALENALFDFTPERRISLPDGSVNTIPYHVLKTLDLEQALKAGQVYRAIDSGWFPDPTIVLWILHLGNRYIVINEKLWYRTVASDIAADIKREDARLGITRVATTYCDPSMDMNTPADIRTLRDIYESHGIPMDCSINSRELYASSIHTALNEEVGENLPRLQILGPSCPYLVKTLPQQRYNPKKPLALANHRDDHGVIALAYFLMSHASEERREFSLPSMLPRWMQPKAGKRQVLGSESVRD